MSDEFLRTVVPIFFWIVIASSLLSAFVSMLALAVNLPPTKTEIGPGLRVLKVVLGVFNAWFIYSIFRFLVPA